MSETIIFKTLVKIGDNNILEDGSLNLLEKTIVTERQVKIWVKSKEAGCHNVPHVHASFGDREYSIAIDGTNVLLAPEKEDKFYRCIVKQYFGKDWLQKFRDYWNNKTDSKMKFKIDLDGAFSSSYSMKNA